MSRQAAEVAKPERVVYNHCWLAAHKPRNPA